MFSLLRTTPALGPLRSHLRAVSVRYASKPSTDSTQSASSSDKSPSRPQHDTAETVPAGKNSLPGSGSSNPQDRVPGEMNSTGGTGQQTADKDTGKETVDGPLGSAKSPKKE